MNKRILAAVATILAAILACVMLLSLTACGSSVPASANESDPAAGNNRAESLANEQTPEPSEPPIESNLVEGIFLPDDLSQYGEGDTFDVGSFGNEPAIIKTYSTDDGFITLSVPEIPDSLKQFAQSRGDSYIMVYSENAEDGSVLATVFFYQNNCTLILQEAGGAFWRFLQPRKVDASFSDKYLPYWFNFGNIEGSEYKLGFSTGCQYVEEATFDDGTTGRAFEQWIDISVDDYTHGAYTETSMHPTEEQIQILLQAVETLSAD